MAFAWFHRRRGASSIALLRLWTASTASGIATWALPFVLGLIALEGGLTPSLLGVVLAVRTIGFLAAVPVAGVLADRLGPRRVIFSAGVAAAAGMAAMTGGFAMLGIDGTLVLAAGALLAGIGQGACRPAFQAIVPAIVSPEGLQSANAAMSISVRVTTLLGPAAATAAALVFGGRATLLFIAALWLVAALLPPNPNSSATRTCVASTSFRMADFWRELLEGLAEARRHPWFVAGLIALTCVIATGYSVTAVILPVVSGQYHGGPVLMTASATAYTLGALIGAAILTRWKPSDTGWIALACLSLYGLVPFSLMAPFHISVPIMAYFIAGIGIEIFNVPWFTSVQREVPQDKLSRVSSIDFLTSYGLAPLGLAVMAPLTNWIGIGAVLALCGVISVVVPLAAMLVPTTRYFANGADRSVQH